MSRVFEVIVRNVEEAILACKYGAQRLELIDDFVNDGCSPDLYLAKDVIEAVTIPVNVMVRPHGNEFILDVNDMNQVNKEVDFLLNSTQVNGLVFGSLTDKNTVNFEQLKIVSDGLIGSKVNLTFHRAIDCTHNIIDEFARLVEFTQLNNRPTHVLSSGGFASVIDGIDNIKKFQDIVKANKTKIKIIAGSGITPTNLPNILLDCNETDIHMGSGVRNALGELSLDKFTKVIELLKYN